MKYIVIEHGINYITNTAVDKIPQIKCPECSHEVFDKDFEKVLDVRKVRLTCLACGCEFYIEGDK